MIQIQSSDVDLDREMIQIQWWCSILIQIQWWCSVLIQIERWSRSSDDVLYWSRSRDDPDPVMMFYVDPDREMIQIQWRWLEDKDYLKTRWSSWYREEDQCWKLCRKNTFWVKRECWCICNFGMYSSIVTRCLFRDVSIMYLSHVVMPWCSDREDYNVNKSYQVIG